MRRILQLLMLCLWGASPALAAPVVATDAEFAPVARALAALYHDQGGGAVEVALWPAPADLVLGPDAALADALIESGAAQAASRFTYAMGASGTDLATAPRDAVLMQAAGAEARAFAEFLLSSEAWDLIVAEGFGAH